MCYGEGNGTPLQYFGWKIPWTEEPGRLQSMGLLESDMTERLPFHFSLSCIGEGNDNPLQYSCLENPRDGGPWWAAIYGVTQSRSQLKRLSSSSSSFRICPFNEYSELISFRIDWFDLLAVQGTVKSLLQHYILKASVLWLSAFFMVQLSHLYVTAGKTIALTV